MQQGLKRKGVAEAILPMGVAAKQEVCQRKIVVSLNIHWTIVMLIKAYCYDWWMIVHHHKQVDRGE